MICVDTEAGIALYIKTNDGIQIKIVKHTSSDPYKQKKIAQKF